MNRIEFAEVIANLAVAIGQPIARDDATAKQRVDIYFRMLSDLPLDDLRLAAEKLVLERKWPTFPQVAEIREVAVSIMHRHQSCPDVGQAWNVARMTALRLADESLDYRMEAGERIPTSEWNRRKMEKLPIAVAESLLQFGVVRMRETPTDQLGVAFAQFRTIYEANAARVKSDRLLPEFMRKKFSEPSQGALSPSVANGLAKIGRLPDDT